ncbi:MAG: (2Fe-2S)-binding protein [Acidobacteriota bacterium]
MSSVETESHKQFSPDRFQKDLIVIICICRGKSERHIDRAIDAGASSVADLQACGVGDQCGSCHNSLRALLARADVSAAAASASSCPASLPELALVPSLA